MDISAYHGLPTEVADQDVAHLYRTKPKDTADSRATALAHARAMRFKAWDAAAAQRKHDEFEQERVAQLYADELANPDDFCMRVSPMPTDGVCSHCWTKGTLVPEEQDHFMVFSCMMCGADYYPNAEPIPLAEAPKTARHHDTLPGERHMQYDEEYRKNRKRSKTQTA